MAIQLTKEEEKERRRLWARNYAEKHPDRLKESKRKYREKHKERLAAEGKEKRKQQREQLYEQKQKWIKDNPDAVALQRARHRIANENRMTGNSLKFHYGVTLEAYRNIAALQGGVCMICGELAVTNRVKRLVVDHDHDHGQLRGLLCHRCNCGLGYFKDNIERIKKAIIYLSLFDEAKNEQQWENRVRFVLANLSAQDGESSR